MKTIYLTLVDCSGLEQEYEKWDHLLTQQRRDKIKRLKKASDRALSIGAELAALASIKQHDLSITNPFYEYDQNGKPQLNVPDRNISLAHSGAVALCALSDVELGADIEAPRRLSRSLSRAVLSPDELITGGMTDTSLLEKWTVKESYLKLTGEGIRYRAMNNITVNNGTVLRDGRLAAFCRTAQFTASGSGNYTISCCAYKEFDIDTVFLASEQLEAILLCSK